MKYTLLLSQPCLGPQLTLLRPVMARISLVPPRVTAACWHGVARNLHQVQITTFFPNAKALPQPAFAATVSSLSPVQLGLALAINCQDSSTAAQDRHAGACVFLSKTVRDFFQPQCGQFNAQSARVRCLVGGYLPTSSDSVQASSIATVDIIFPARFSSNNSPSYHTYTLTRSHSIFFDWSFDQHVLGHTALRRSPRARIQTPLLV